MGRRSKSQEKAAHAVAEKAARDALAVEVGTRLRWTRLALEDMKQGPTSAYEFAHSLGLSKGRYSNFENGTSMLPPDVAVRICRKYGVNLNWIYAGDETWIPDAFQKALDKARTDNPR